LTIIAAAEAKIKPTVQLALQDAVAVLKPSNALQKTTDKVIDEMIKKKPALEKANVAAVVGATLVKFKAASESILAVVKLKLPDNVKAVGDSIGKKINESLDKGIKAFPA